jgi:putative inorganic carbon (HCO3(-)) transporter
MLDFWTLSVTLVQVKVAQLILNMIRSKKFMEPINFCNKIIRYSFYALFFFVPLVFVGSTSELFEFNKMWLTFAVTIVIMTAWITKMILQKQIVVQKTQLDWFIVAFLVSQIISSLISLDNRISFWGYYSRFNGGLLSMISYALLYYAFVTHFNKKQAKTFLLVNIVSGFFVALWGLPSHFGKDPTCLVFRGQLDVNCWTDAFKPTIRMFSTLGQPAWLSAYMAALLPITMVKFLQSFYPSQSQNANGKFSLSSLFFLLATLLFYACLLYSNTRAGFLAFWAGNIFFWGILFIKKMYSTKQFLSLFILLNTCYILLNFFIGTPISQLEKFSYHTLTKRTEPVQPQTAATSPGKAPAPADAFEPNITNSGDIRLYVWRGALDAWKDNFLFGTGVETFAFAYYKYRPVGHNTTSEWDYLYNKAHNEYLNYLTTTGALGLGTYLLIIIMFCFLMFRLFHGSMASWLRSKNNETMKQLSNEEHEEGLEKHNTLLTIGLFSGWLTILITNFFGFSIVIMNMLFFILPACAFVVGHLLPTAAIHYPREKHSSSHITVSRWVAVGSVAVVGLYFIYFLFNFWEADKVYALGSNLDHAGEYQTAYPLLQQASTMLPAEPVYKDELSYNSAQMAVALYQAQQATPAAELAQQAVSLSDEVLLSHPNNVVFWKTRVRIFYTLAQLDQRYLPYAVKAAEQASAIAPTDAKIWWNLGVLYGQNGETQKAITTLEKTIQMKPDYVDAYYALGLFYHDSGVDSNGKVLNKAYADKAITTMQHIVDNLDPQNEQVKKALKEWTGRTK